VERSRPRPPLPVLLIVNGYAASGKTTLARALSRELRWPLVPKDEFKELLFDRLGAIDYKESKQLGAAAIDVMFGVARELLVAGTSVIIESPLLPRYDNARIRALEHEAEFLTIQLVLTGDPRRALRALPNPRRARRAAPQPLRPRPPLGHARDAALAVRIAHDLRRDPLLRHVEPLGRGDRRDAPRDRRGRRRVVRRDRFTIRRVIGSWSAVARAACSVGPAAVQSPRLPAA